MPILHMRLRLTCPCHRRALPDCQPSRLDVPLINWEDSAAFRHSVNYVLVLDGEYFYKKKLWG